MMDIEGYQKWLEERRLRPRTVSAYVQCVKIAFKRGEPVKSVLGASSLGRRQQLYAALKHYAAFLGGMEGARLQNELMALPRFRDPERPPRRPLSNLEWKRLLEAAGDEEGPVGQVLTLLVYTGLRCSDIINIEHVQVREGLKTGTMYLAQKGGSYRPFPVEGDIRRVLFELDDGWHWTTIENLLTRGKSDRAAYMVLYRALQDAAERAGLEKNRRNPHLLRATAAIQLYRRTEDIYQVMRWLGHKSINTTLKYLRGMDPEELGEIYQKLEESREE
jgi:integrase